MRTSAWDRFFRQNSGDSMGSDAASFFDNFFYLLWIRVCKENFTRKYNSVSQKINDTFQFIGDLIAVNDCNEFEKLFKQISAYAAIQKGNIFIWNIYSFPFWTGRWSWFCYDFEVVRLSFTILKYAKQYISLDY